MTTPSSQFLSQPLLLLLLLPPAILAAAAEEQQPTMPHPDCPTRCGDMDIPFPFGIGRGCFRDGFEVLCNDSFVPPRPFLADSKIHRRVANYSAATGLSRLSWSPLELRSISAGSSEARVYAAISYRCIANLTESTFSTEEQDMEFSHRPFAVSATGNVLTGVGFDVKTRLGYQQRERNSFADMSCSAQDFPPRLTARNGSCNGQGCCEEPLSPYNFPGKHFTVHVSGGALAFRDEWQTTIVCIYSMLVEKSWYHFSTPDMYGDKALLQKFPRGVPLLLDFAAGNTSCPAEGQPRPPDFACVHGNSSCANTTVTIENTYTTGYICKCLDYYAGNPYVPNGCQDIDECKQGNPCSNGGICKNRLGGYDCPCKSGMKHDGKGGHCAEVFPLAAKATVGVIGGIFLFVFLLFIVILHKEKKKMKEFYKKNGGPTLEKANVIKLFKKGDLKPILKNSNLIGKGCFGEVYKGLLDNKLVAIKKPINGSVLQSDQFANEVIIQSQVIHKNIVRLIGCCLEVDAPMLVYEFISQGSLHDILHNSNNNKVFLNLDARVSIAAQSADGLAYMHSKANITILHGDVKPANILLDDNFVAKISDFGISRLIARDKEHTGLVIGDMNYMDPVYLQEGLLTEKSDVYSFGVVILELISSRRAIHSETNSLVKSFLEAHKKHNKATELFDKELAVAKDLELLDSLANMAIECLSLDVDQRPTMMEVAERLLIINRSRKL